MWTQGSSAAPWPLGPFPAGPGERVLPAGRGGSAAQLQRAVRTGSARRLPSGTRGRRGNRGVQGHELSWDSPSLWPAVSPVPSPGQGYRELSFTTALQCLPDAESRTVGPNKP